jgi:hypothetical protein
MLGFAPAIYFLIAFNRIDSSNIALREAVGYQSIPALLLALVVGVPLLVAAAVADVVWAAYSIQIRRRNARTGG